MMRFDIFLWLTLLLPNMGMAASLFDVDDDFPQSSRGTKGHTVNVPVSRYYPTDTHSALYKVLKQAQILTANVSFMGRDGVPYKQHSWNAGSDRANLRRGIDCSRSIWFAFTRAGIPYNPQNRYVATAQMWQENSDMRHNFRRCSIDDLRLGDVLVYRGGGKGHTVMVLDPKEKLAWGSHGWDKSRHKDTGVEVQKVVSINGWRSWDKYSMKLKACWRHQDFTKQPVIAQPTLSHGMYPETRSRHLSNADLRDKTRYALWIMRNEMFARYGYRFENGELAKHFQQHFWYMATHLSSTVIFYYHFSGLERSNVKFIYQYEQNRMTGNQEPVDEQPQTTTTHQGSVGDYPETAIRRLTSADIAGKSQQELRIMRNEIYARHGYRFGKYDLQTHFEKKSWYKPITTNGGNLYHNHFTQIERDNIDFIRQYE
jgi:hypothetical protein